MFTIKTKVIILIAIFTLVGNASAYAANKEIYDLNTQTIKYTSTDLMNLKNQMDAGLHSSKYGYEYNGQVYKFGDVTKIYVSERKKGNKKMSSILEKVQTDSKSVFQANDFSIKGTEWSEEPTANILYVTVTDAKKVTGVTVDGESLVLDGRYAIEQDGRVKISFLSNTDLNSIGTVVIKVGNKDYPVNLQLVNPTISSIDPISTTVKQGDVYSLPTTVKAKFSDGTTKDVSVTWNSTTVDTSKVSTTTYLGTVSGYTSTVTLTLNVTNSQVDTRFITEALFSEELIENALYVSVTDNTKVTGVTVNGKALVLGEGYKIDTDGRLKITFPTTTTKDTIGTVVIKVQDKDYTVDNKTVGEEFDVFSIE